jgi:hypothetical protein
MLPSRRPFRVIRHRFGSAVRWASEIMEPAP